MSPPVPSILINKPAAAASSTQQTMQSKHPLQQTALPLKGPWNEQSTTQIYFLTLTPSKKLHLLILWARAIHPSPPRLLPSTPYAPLCPTNPPVDAEDEVQSRATDRPPEGPRSYCPAVHYNQCIKKNKTQNFKSKIVKFSTGEFSKQSSFPSNFFCMEDFVKIFAIDSVIRPISFWKVLDKN